MPQPQPSKHISPFEAIRHTDEQGEDYWLARELMAMLGYPRWNDAKPAIDRSMGDCEKSGRNVAEVFRIIPQNPGKSGGRPKTDFHLTRYACRLIVMAANPRTTDAIASHARTYFSDQVEVAEQMGAQPQIDKQAQMDAQIAAIEEMIQDARMRVETRDKLTASYNQLEAIAHVMGMSRPAHFARLHNEGDMGMFTMSKDALAQRHGVEPQPGKKKVNMNDHLNTTLMGGIIVRNAFAGADISQMEQPANQDMWDASYSAGREIREMMLKHGIVPEDMPPEPHISEAKRLASGQLPLLPVVLEPAENEASNEREDVGGDEPQ